MKLRRGLVAVALLAGCGATEGHGGLDAGLEGGERTRLDAGADAVADTAPSEPGLTARITASPASGEAPLRVTLSGCGSSETGGTVVQFAWDFGDGTYGVGPVVAHTYSRGGYTARLTVAGARGGSASATAAISAQGDDAPPLVTTTTGHPRLYVDAAHVTDLRARVARTPILGAAGYRNSYVAGYLLDSHAWEAADYYRGNSASNGCRVFLGTTLTAASGAMVQQSRHIADCLTTLAAGATLATDSTAASGYAASAIAALEVMAGTWPQSGGLNAGFGRWTCGACSDGGSNLNNGELLYGAAVAFDLLYPQMTDAQRADVRALLIREARWTFMNSHDAQSWWSQPSSNNWQAVVHGGFGVAALALLGEPGLNAGEAEGWIAYATDRVHTYLANNYDADGVNFEDADHFKYGLSFAVEYLAALRNVRGTDAFDEATHAVRNATRYYVYATDPVFDGVMPNDGTGPNATTYPTLLRLATESHDGFAQWAWDRVAGHARQAWNTAPFKVGGDGDQSQLLQTAFGYDDAVAIESPEGRWPLAAVFPQWGRAIFRDGWDDPQGAFLGVEAGVIGSHGKPNQGHFFLSAYGAHLAQNGPTAWTGGTPQFNVLELDRASQQQPGDPRAVLATTRSWLGSGAFDYVGYDTHAAYAVTGLAAERGFVFVPPAAGQGAYALVLDRLAASASHAYAWLLHPDPHATLSTVASGHYRATGASASLDIVAAGASSPIADTSAGLRLGYTGDALTLATLLYPTNASHALPAVQDLAWTGGAGVRVGGDTWLFAPDGAAASQGDVQGQGEVVFVRRAGSAVTAVGLVHGQSVAVGGVTYAQASTPVNLALAYDGDALRVTVAPAPGTAATVVLRLHAASAGAAYVRAEEGQIAAGMAADGAGVLTVDLGAVTRARTLVLSATSAAPSGCM